MSETEFEVRGPSWTTWDLAAEQWSGIARLLGVLHTAGPFYAIVNVAGELDRIHVVSNGGAVWVLRLEQGTLLSVLGAHVESPALTQVQIEYREEVIEDPPPAMYWLPKQLGLGIDDAIEMANVALTNSAALPSTRVDLFPSNAR